MSLAKSFGLLLAVLSCLMPLAAADDQSSHEYPWYFDKVVLAHGLMGCLAWVILAPLGGIIIRVCSFKGVFWAHAAIQTLVYVMYIFVFATGIWFCWLYGSASHPHVILGILIFGFATIQPFTGTVHHLIYKYTGCRSLSSYLHIHLGRGLVTLGMINGGLGLFITEAATKTEMQFYGIFSAMTWVMYIIIVSVKETKTNRQAIKRLNEASTETLNKEQIQFTAKHGEPMVEPREFVV